MALVRMRWAIWGTAALVGLGAGIGLLVLRSSGPAASTSMVGGAATTWPAGKQKAPVFGLLDQAKKIAGVEVHDIVHTEAAYVVDANGYERALYLWPFTGADVLKVLRTFKPA